MESNGREAQQERTRETTGGFDELVVIFVVVLTEIILVQVTEKVPRERGVGQRTVVVGLKGEEGWVRRRELLRTNGRDTGCVAKEG